jgi:serine/threonine protein kinase/Tol biopolymer transport system component
MSERWQRIEQLYHAALEREESQRASFLKETCAGDDALRQEVESLLAQGEGAEGFLEAPALEVAAKMLGEDPDRSLLGRRMGSYQILSLLGSGGMGGVFEARDSKLGRNVAIKVLPAAFAHDPERLSRFEREAKILASLNHPNIATIHGLEQSDGLHYLVMELVPGETLAERLRAGAFAIEEALRIGGQIAEALEAAHEKGVIHRDLKPANVKVTPEGRVKVLDFGLAKAFAGDGGLDLSHEPKLTAIGTEEGRILGTPAYMSPEQARGKPVDKRTDIWAWGCVLYELLTARQAFRGETLSDTIAGVLEREPDWQVLPPATPAKVRDLLRRCLQKDSQHRLRDIGDARIEIEEALTATVAAELSAPVKGIRARWQGALLWGVAFLVLAAVTSIAVWNRKSSSPIISGPVSRIAITLPPGQPLAGLEMGIAVALSPDGTHLVYAARQGGIQQLYLRPLDGLETKLIQGTEGATEPFFSPDGQWVGFFAGGKLKKVPLSGGEALSLCDAADPRGASWGSQGVIIFAPTRASALVQVSDAGGTPWPLAHLEKDENSHRWPEFLPGGQTVLFAALNSGANWNNARVAVQSVATGERLNLIQGATHPRYAPSEHLIYVHRGNLMAVPFDPQRLQVTGAAVPVVEGVLQSTFSGAAQYSFSATGSLVYVPGGDQSSQRRLRWVSRSGVEQPVAAPARAYRGPRLSPDGRRVAVGIEEQETQVWLYDLARETLARFTLEGSTNYDPLWTPDGKRITFHSTTGVAGLFWQLADGSGGRELLTKDASGPSSWSPDGQLLARNLISAAGWNISVFRLSDRKQDPFLETTFNKGAASFSSDGHWLAYTSDESGRYEIYVQPYPGPGGKWQISTEGGTEPVWSRKGRELFYRSGDKMIAVEITTQPSFSAGKPKVLFAGHYQPSAILNANYDVSSDGQRFLMLKPGGQDQAATQINVVLNWFEELKRRVPPAKK